VRELLDKFNLQLEELAVKLQGMEHDYTMAEQEYNFANATYNDGNLQFTRQQSKVNALKQEALFKTNQLNDLHSQITNSNQQLDEAFASINETASSLEVIQETLVQLLQRRRREEAERSRPGIFNLRNVLNEKKVN
jgi:chromosome segregation protein